MKKKLLMIFLVFLLSVSFVGCNKSTNNTQAPDFAILTQDNTLAQQKIQENLTRAKGAAAVWNTYAQYVALVLKVSPSMQADTLTETFVFGAPNDPYNWWTFSISEKNDKIVRALTPKEDFLGTDFQPIKEENIKISYLEALKTAETSGGLAFRAENLNPQVNIVLAQTSPKNWLWWKIEYNGEAKSLKININALDGNVSDDTGNPMSATPSPDASSSSDSGQ